MPKRRKTSKTKKGGCSGALALACLLKKRHYKGGGVPVEFAKPQVNQTTTSGAIGGAMHSQKESNAELTEVNKEMSGGGMSSDSRAAAEKGAPAPRGESQGEVVIPQMDQAGSDGNASIGGGIETTLQGNSEAEYDTAVTKGPAKPTYKGGRRRSCRCRKCPEKCCSCCRCKQKHKTRRKSRKKRRKSRKKRRKSRKKRRKSRRRKSRRRR